MIKHQQMTAIKKTKGGDDLFFL